MAEPVPLDLEFCVLMIIRSPCLMLVLNHLSVIFARGNSVVDK